jgi:prolyl 4-hydroxylase
VQTRISRASRLPLVNMEGATVLHYDIGEEIENHYDFVEPSIPDYEQHIATRGERVMTFLVYLNDDYAGGETDFPTLGVTHKGRRGEGLFFRNALPDGTRVARRVRVRNGFCPSSSGTDVLYNCRLKSRPLRGHR